MSDETRAIPKDELYELYQILADATQAAADGDPNKCASLAADAKERVLELNEEYADNEY
jgi:hypothetical protein